MKIVNRVIVAGAMVLFLAGCSGNDNNGSKEPDTDATDALHEEVSADGTHVDTTEVLVTDTTTY